MIYDCGYSCTSSIRFSFCVLFQNFLCFENKIITKTYLYNFDPLKLPFYIVKLGFTGVYIIFLISAQNIDCGYSLEPPHWGGSNEYPQSMFWAEVWNYQSFLSEIFQFREVVVVVLRFYGPVNPMGSCRARSVYLTTRLLGRLSPPSG